MKETSETNKVGFTLSKKVYTPSNTVSVNPKNQNKSLLYGETKGIQQKDLLHTTSTASIPKRTTTKQLMVSKSKELTPLTENLEKQANNVKNALKASNKNFTTRNLASCSSFGRK